MTLRRLFASFGLLCLVCVVVFAASEVDGTWRGTFNGQPIQLMPDGSFPETVNRFELRLREEGGGRIVGDFRNLDEGKPTRHPISSGGRFGDHVCFDVVIAPEDMRWCVQASGNNLTGSWSAGPKGGPMLGGAGTGARFFRISGSKAN